MVDGQCENYDRMRDKEMKATAIEMGIRFDNVME